MKPRPDASSFAASRRRWLAPTMGLLLAAGVVAAIVLATRSPSPGPAGNASRAGGAAIVQRRNLVETDTVSGTLGYADPESVYNRLSGTITWLPAVGRVIKPGLTLYWVNGHPVVLLDGALPAYRGLKAGDSDSLDILQFNRDLVRMGFAEGQITVDGTWQTGTTDSVKRWQASLGEKQTGKISLGRIVFLPGAQRVTQLETTCGSTGGGPASGSSSGSGSGPTNGCGVSEGSATVPTPHPEFVDLTTSSTTMPTTTTPATTPKGTEPPSRHKLGSGSGNAKASGSGSGKGSGSGSGAGSASAILQTTSTQLVVTVDLDASKQSEAKVGETVTVETPAGDTVNGRITEEADTKTRQHRTVRLLAPLAADLRLWRMAAGHPDDDQLVFPGKGT